jgi:hypothetical protein
LEIPKPTAPSLHETLQSQQTYNPKDQSHKQNPNITIAKSPPSIPLYPTPPSKFFSPKKESIKDKK